MNKISTYRLRNNTSIPCVGIGTGIIRKRANNIFHFFFLFLKEHINNIRIEGYKKNNKYPILRDVRRNRKIPKILKYYAQNCSPAYFDTARAYSLSEGVLGDILSSCHLERDNLFVISKIRNVDQKNKSEEECVMQSLNELKLDYLDLLLLHWPQTGTFVDSYKTIMKLQETGLTKGIGVANFNIHHIEELVANDCPLPLVNEIECHPYYQQKELVEYCNKHQIQVIAYTPTGRKMKEFSSLTEVQNMCKKYNVRPVEIIMSWHYSRGIIPIFSTTKKEHVKENVCCFINGPVPFTEKELEYIASLDRGEKFFPDPDNCDFSKL